MKQGVLGIPAHSPESYIFLFYSGFEYDLGDVNTLSDYTICDLIQRFWGVFWGEILT